MSRRNRRRAALRKKPKQRATPIKQGGWTPFKLDEELSARMRTPCYVNNHYSVQTMELPNGITYLSIKRLKKEARHDWRELWRIKNELTSENREAIELYPAASRVVDTSNQYHLWVMPDGWWVPLGWTKAEVTDDATDRYKWGKARQRRLPEWMDQYRATAGDEQRLGAPGKAPEEITLLQRVNPEGWWVP